MIGSAAIDLLVLMSIFGEIVSGIRDGPFVLITVNLPIAVDSFGNLRAKVEKDNEDVVGNARENATGLVVSALMVVVGVVVVMMVATVEVAVSYTHLTLPTTPYV